VTPQKVWISCIVKMSYLVTTQSIWTPCIVKISYLVTPQNIWTPCIVKISYLVTPQNIWTPWKCLTLWLHRISELPVLWKCLTLWLHRISELPENFLPCDSTEYLNSPYWEYSSKKLPSTDTRMPVSRGASPEVLKILSENKKFTTNSSQHLLECSLFTLIKQQQLLHCMPNSTVYIISA
jgi:hypothetical protein